ncbi:hypothetical protein ACTXG6_33420 [Pseudonocardia sp. Cha107L01]
MAEDGGMDVEQPLPPVAFFQTGATLTATLAVSLFLQVHYFERMSDRGNL